LGIFGVKTGVQKLQFRVLQGRFWGDFGPFSTKKTEMTKIRQKKSKKVVVKVSGF
jgi:hypothetical protein